MNNVAMNYDSKQELTEYFNSIKFTDKVIKLDELYDKVVFSNLNNETVSLLQELIKLKAENIILKNYDKTS